MATPTYNGTGQPATAGGWLSGLGSWFSGPAPAYSGKGQSAQGATGFLGGATPAYKPAPTPNDGSASTPTAVDELCPEHVRITLLFPRELMEPRQ